MKLHPFKMPAKKTRKFRRDRTEISCCLKYSIFGVNCICWVSWDEWENFCVVQKSFFFAKKKNICLQKYVVLWRRFVDFYCWVSEFGLSMRRMCSKISHQTSSTILHSCSSFSVSLSSSSVKFALAISGEIVELLTYDGSNSYRIYWLCWFITWKYIPIVAGESTALFRLFFETLQFFVSTTIPFEKNRLNFLFSLFALSLLFSHFGSIHGCWLRFYC